MNWTIFQSLYFNSLIGLSRSVDLQRKKPKMCIHTEKLGWGGGGGFVVNYPPPRVHELTKQVIYVKHSVRGHDISHKLCIF